MQPVLEIHTSDGFDLWPVAEIEPFGFLALGGRLSPAEVGTAVMRIAVATTSTPTAIARLVRPMRSARSFTDC